MYNDYCQPFLELCAACIQSVVHFSSTLTKILNLLMNSRFTSKNNLEQLIQICKSDLSKTRQCLILCRLSMHKIVTLQGMLSSP